MADAPDLGSGGFSRGGSSPPSRISQSAPFLNGLEESRRCVKIKNYIFIKGTFLPSFRLVLIVTLLGTAGTAGLYGCGKSAPPPPANKSAPSADPKPVATASIPATTQMLENSIEAVGSLLPQEEVVLGSEIDGVVEGVFADLGDAVAKGTLLVKIKDTDQNLKVRETEAQLKRANQEFQRGELLVKDGYISQGQFDDLKTQYEVAQTAFEIAREQSSKTAIFAPFSGQVKEKSVTRGQNIRIHDPLISLVLNNPLKLRIEVPEQYMGEIKAGGRVEVEVSAFQGKVFEGVINRISPSVDMKTRTITVEALIPNANRSLKSGTFAKATIQTGVRRKGVMVPQEAIVQVAGESKVFLIQNGTAIERIVKTGARKESLVEVTEGVMEGDLVAVRNLSQLSNGIKVQPERAS